MDVRIAIHKKNYLAYATKVFFCLSKSTSGKKILWNWKWQFFIVYAIMRIKNDMNNVDIHEF